MRRFYFRLAEHLGGMTVGEMLEKISSMELTEWQAHFILTNEEQKEREMVQSAVSGAETRRWSR